MASRIHRAGPASKPIHIFNGFQNPHGGSELEALGLQALLCDQASVHLWATSSRADPGLMRAHGIGHIDTLRGQRPDGGTYVFVGAHWRNKLWPYLVPRPARLIYVYNTFHPKAIALTSAMPPLLAWPAAQYVLISAFQQALAHAPGAVQVHPSPIDIDRFAPAPRTPAGAAPVVIGRMSRDLPDKHDPQDIALYRALATQGHRVLLQGARCIAAQLADLPQIEVAGEGAQPPETFLRRLDIFYYRSGVHVETFGRVVFEAMACGLPVVCHANGGYADSIRHGENGFLFSTTAQAQAILDRLLADPALRVSVGAAARRTVEQLYSPAAMQERAAFYLRD